MEMYLCQQVWLDIKFKIWEDSPKEAARRFAQWLAEDEDDFEDTILVTLPDDSTKTFDVILLEDGSIDIEEKEDEI